MPTEIRLDKLESNQIDLSAANPYVRIVGEWQGDRLVFLNHQGKTIMLDGCRIESTRTAPDKNAIAFAGPCKGLNFHGASGAKIINGGIAFWDKIEDSVFRDLEIMYANIAFHAARDVINQDVTFANNRILYPMREAFYIGPHYYQENRSERIVIEGNEILGAGWDAIQVNAKPAYIRHNKIYGFGITDTNYQNYAMTFQPGSLVFYHDNEIQGQGQNIVQSLDCRSFNTSKY